MISVLNVTVHSEASNDPGKALPNGLAYIWVNNKNYAPQTKGYNVAVFDALSGRSILFIRLFTSVEQWVEALVRGGGGGGGGSKTSHIKTLVPPVPASSLVTSAS